VVLVPASSSFRAYRERILGAPAVESAVAGSRKRALGRPVVTAWNVCVVRLCCSHDGDVCRKRGGATGGMCKGLW
jgi:hypothetical protein